MSSNLNPYVTLGAGLLIGAATTYLTTREVLKKKYENIANEEIESVKATYSKRAKTTTESKKPTLTSPLDIVKDEYHTKIAELGYIHRDEINALPDKVQYVSVDVLTVEERSGEWPGSEIDVLVLERTDEVPYLITTDEFLDELQVEHEKFSLTWYTDDILADDRDQVVEDVAGMVGRHNLECFGQGSDGPNTIYVRNIRLKTDFEVSKDMVSYIDAVSGLDDPEETVWVTPKTPIKKMRPLSD